MPSRFSGYRWVLIVFWVLAFAAIPVWNGLCPDMDWDAKMYFNTVHSLHAGHNIYADQIEALAAFNAQPALHLRDRTPAHYLYPPLTLLLLRQIGSFPPIFYIWCYWLIYIAGVLSQIWVAMQAAESMERRFVAFLAPAVAFFPGLLQEATLMDGNVAYILYGMIFVTAYLGWRYGQWRWFYLATLAASCFKIPMLSLLAIPILSARKQWLHACLTAAAGVILFVMQPWIWPSYFHGFLHALDLEFSLKHGLGVGPAGLFGALLLNANLPYYNAYAICYITYALPLFGLMLYLSRQFLDGKFSREQWIPVMVTGVILLNPRIMQYDYAPVTLFMALILWRTVVSLTSFRRAVVLCSLFFVAINLAVVLIDLIDTSYFYLKCIEGFLLAGAFAAGCWNLLRQTRESAISAGIPSTIG
jgi:hypothetical protein